MKRFTTLAVSVALALAQHPALAAEWGKDYQELAQAQKTEVRKGQVEVLEFFWYGCPHCFELEPEFKSWAKKLPKDVVVRRVPGILKPDWVPMARAYYALEALGVLGKLHGELFNAIHIQGMDLDPPGRFLDWAASKGLNRKQAADAYNDFTVNTKVLRAQQMTAAYNLNGVPAFAVNGRYVTSAYMTGGVPTLFKTLDTLIAQERRRNGRK